MQSESQLTAAWKQDDWARQLSRAVPLMKETRKKKEPGKSPASKREHTQLVRFHRK